ncbi:CLUMA_CG009164, isoform A [Clunio marinus]|uniref:CLUMA_CG009164, isoform A n=1 Tax=Clunio marinus TaxID=568069 RepID=A0A1J1I689_9DIPT|nr:CLUMA_CG009164, isoform A [Clunio marinus]
MFRSKSLYTKLTNAITNAAALNVTARRTLYSPTSLGIDRFLEAREKSKLQINNIDQFKSKMLEFTSEENTKSMVFTEDLKNMLHISDKDDLDLLVKMIKRFNLQSKEVRFGNFIFGTPIMRLLHFLKEPEIALQLFKDSSLKGFFDQIMSYHLLLDLLFQSEQYQDILNTFDIIKSRQIQGGRFPKNVIVLTFAACYKLNTPESYEYARKLWKEILDSGIVPMRRAVTFFASLALDQASPQIALEILSVVRQQNYLTVRSIKVLSLVKLQRYDDVLPVLQSVFHDESEGFTKKTFPSDVIETLREEFKKSPENEIKIKFKKIVDFLKEHDHITSNSLDEILCSEIEQMPMQNFTMNDDSRNRGRNNEWNQPRNDQRRYQRQNSNYSYGSYRNQRPGLNEMN